MKHFSHSRRRPLEGRSSERNSAAAAVRKSRPVESWPTAGRPFFECGRRAGGHRVAGEGHRSHGRQAGEVPPATSGSRRRDRDQRERFGDPAPKASFSLRRFAEERPEAVDHRSFAWVSSIIRSVLKFPLCVPILQTVEHSADLFFIPSASLFCRPQTTPRTSFSTSSLSHIHPFKGRQVNFSS